MLKPKPKLEGNRSWQYTIERRDRCVKRIMEETGIGKYEAEIAYRISTIGLVDRNGDVRENNGESN